MLHGNFIHFERWQKNSLSFFNFEDFFILSFFVAKWTLFVHFSVREWDTKSNEYHLNFSQRKEARFAQSPKKKDKRGKWRQLLNSLCQAKVMGKILKPFTWGVNKKLLQFLFVFVQDHIAFSYLSFIECLLFPCIFSHDYHVMYIGTFLLVFELFNLRNKVKFRKFREKICLFN